MRLLSATLLAAGCALLLLAGCAAPAFRAQNPDAYDIYRSASRSKALAFVQGENGAFAYGMSTGQSTEQLAIRQALDQCTSQRVAKDVEGACRVRMVNERRVDD